MKITLALFRLSGCFVILWTKLPMITRHYTSITRVRVTIGETVSFGIEARKSLMVGNSVAENIGHSTTNGTMINTRSISLINSFIVEARDSDGFINATQLCKAGGKMFGHWMALDSTKAYLQTVSSNTGIPVLELIDKSVGGSHTGSWVQQHVAVKLAQWLSPEFEFRVSQWVIQLATVGYVKLGEEKTHEELLQLQRENKQLKLDIQHTKESHKRLETTHKSMLRKRQYHKFKKGPVFYIISDIDQKSRKYKVGIDDVDINVRLQQHRSTTPAIKLEYLLYTDKNKVLETNILLRFQDNREPFGNHEWIYNVDINHIVRSVGTLVEFLGIDVTEEKELVDYNKDVDLL